jgi:hypothetical protein
MIGYNYIEGQQEDKSNTIVNPLQIPSKSLPYIGDIKGS